MEVRRREHRDVNLWRNAEHAIEYSENGRDLPHRVRGARGRCSRSFPVRVERVLDLGTGDGNMLALVLDARPGAPESASTSRTRCSTGHATVSPATPRVEIVQHDLDDRCRPTSGTFDVVVSSFAIHHLDPPRARALRRGLRPAPAGRRVRERRARGLAHAPAARGVPDALGRRIPDRTIRPTNWSVTERIWPG